MVGSVALRAEREYVMRFNRMMVYRIEQVMMMLNAEMANSASSSIGMVGLTTDTMPVRGL